MLCVYRAYEAAVGQQLWCNKLTTYTHTMLV
jgi:hypothetical protein